MHAIGPREQLDAAIAQLDVALAALHTASEVLISARPDVQRRRTDVVGVRVELIRARRALEELRDETTARHATRDSERAFEAVRAHAERRR